MTANELKGMFRYRRQSWNLGSSPSNAVTRCIRIWLDSLHVQQLFDFTNYGPLLSHLQ